MSIAHYLAARYFSLIYIIKKIPTQKLHRILTTIHLSERNTYTNLPTPSW